MTFQWTPGTKGLNKVAGLQPVTLFEERIQYSCEFSEIFKSNFFIEDLWATPFGVTKAAFKTQPYRNLRISIIKPNPKSAMSCDTFRFRKNFICQKTH